MVTARTDRIRLVGGMRWASVRTGGRSLRFFGSIGPGKRNVQVGGKIVDIVDIVGLWVSGRGVHIVDICAHIVDIVDLSGSDVALASLSTFYPLPCTFGLFGVCFCPDRTRSQRAARPGPVSGERARAPAHSPASFFSSACSSVTGC